MSLPDNNAVKAGSAGVPIHCLVIQLGRLGDTIQTLMALRAAKQLYPRLEIHLVTRERFAIAAKCVPWLKQVITLPTEKLVGPVLSGELGQTEALGDVARWVAPLITPMTNSKAWDMIINWTYSEASSFLTGLLPARIKLGYTRRRDTSFSCADGWSQYVQGVIQSRIEQNIHLIDVLTTQLLTSLQIHYGEPLDPGNAAVASKGFFSLELAEMDLNWNWRDPSKKWIAIQLSGAKTNPKWTPDSWARLVAKVLDEHPDYNAVVLGDETDIPPAEAFNQALKELKVNPKSVLSLVGQTNFDLWATVIGRSQWLLAGDTAAIHLASVLGTRVLNLSFAESRWRETGPYGNAHYVITPRDAESTITPDAVYGVWSYANSEWSHRRHITLPAHFSDLEIPTEMDSIRVFRSKIRAPEDGGGIVYEPVTGYPLQLHEWVSMVLGHIARSWFCGWTPNIGQELNRRTLTPDLLRSIRMLSESADVLEKVCSEARRAALQLTETSAQLRSERVMDLKSRQEINRLAKRLNELDKLIERLANADQSLKAFSCMSKVQMHNLRGECLTQIGKETADAYQQLGEGTRIMKDWIIHTLGVARPRAVESPAPLQELPR